MVRTHRRIPQELRHRQTQIIHLHQRPQIGQVRRPRKIAEELRGILNLRAEDRLLDAAQPRPGQYLRVEVLLRLDDEDPQVVDGQLIEHHDRYGQQRGVDGGQEQLNQQKRGAQQESRGCEDIGVPTPYEFALQDRHVLELQHHQEPQQVQTHLDQVIRVEYLNPLEVDERQHHRQVLMGQLQPLQPLKLREVYTHWRSLYPGVL